MYHAESDNPDESAPRDPSRVLLRLYGELNDFLPVNLRQRELKLTLKDRSIAKDLVEGLGVPHPEVSFILVNGEPASFDRLMLPGDLLSVFPPLARLAPDPEILVTPPPPRPPCFVLDVHLGTLARLLRLMGLDALYANDYGDPELARISAEEERILLSRDRKLLMRRIVVHGYVPRADDPLDQAREVLTRFVEPGETAPFSRCLQCNRLLEDIGKEEILHRLEPLTRQRVNRFQICRGCDRLYWRGAHREGLEETVKLLSEVVARN